MQNGKRDEDGDVVDTLAGSQQLGITFADDTPGLKPLR